MRVNEKSQALYKRLAFLWTEYICLANGFIGTDVSADSAADTVAGIAACLYLSFVLF